MRSSILAAAAFSSAALASVHGHHHGLAQHGHSHELKKRNSVPEKREVVVMECFLGGRILGEAECNEGVKNGTLKFVDEGFIQQKAKASPSSSSAPPPPPSSSAAPSSSAPPPPPPPAYEPVKVNQNYASGGAAANVMNEFPDGQIDCSVFPEAWGAERTDWLKIGGWAAVQKPESDSHAGYSDITTVVPDQCPDGNCCVEGAFCSYACPNGFLKFQWPSKQGATGQSVGGLYCKGGKLHLTNPLVPTLCKEGSSKVKVTVKNKLSQNVAICRTNYPGDEKMSIPVDVNPGEEKKLACPDASNFYKWQGRGTSAQYYINMPGYPVSKACTWGNQGDDFGNFAPGNLGVGWSDGRAWLSITANHPTQMNAYLPYTIELIGGESKCRYRDGKYCSGEGYDNCSSEGCTVSSAGGELTYVLS